VKPVEAASSNSAATGISGVLELIKLHRAYGKHGFRLADLDPLKLHNIMSEHNPENKIPEQLLLESYGFREEDYQNVYDLSNPIVTGFLGANTRPWKGKWKVIDLYNKLREVYSGKIGYEFMYIPYSDESNFMR
jgi:2-oxoglutarate dehydrogenase complex dehydrogenase (E1) component-like enzyme